jgi:cellulose synthase operon protein C
MPTLNFKPNIAEDRFALDHSVPGDERLIVRRSFNWVALAITVVVCVVGGAGLYFLHGYQLTRTADQLLTVVEARERDEEWRKAAEYLDRYLHLRPADAEARGRMALNFGRYANTAPSWMPKQQAINLHYRALATGNVKQAKELRLGLMQLLLDNRRFGEAEKEARSVLEKDPDNAQASRVLAIALASQLADGSLTNVDTKSLRLVKSIERARKLNPDDVRLATILAVVLREYPVAVKAEYPGISERERQQRADESLDQLILDNPHAADAYLGRSAYRTKYGLPDADKDLEVALSLSPEDPEALLAAAVAAADEARKIQQSAGDDAATKKQLLVAQSHYEKLAEAAPDLQVEQSYLGLGDTHFALGEVDKAIEIWRTGLQQFKQPTALIGLHARIAEAAIERDMMSVATESLAGIDQMLAKLGSSIPRDDKLQLTRAQDLRRASWHIKQQNFSAAIPLLRQVILSQPKGGANAQATIRAWMHLGAINSLYGEWLDAATAFDQAVALDPSSPQPRLAAATAWLYAGRADLASERAEQALNHTSAPEAWLALATSHVQQQSQLPPAQRSWMRLERALQALESARSQIREGWRIDFLRAEYAIAKAKTAGDAKQGLEEAARLLRVAETMYGGDPGFWSQICIIYQTLKLEIDAERSIAQMRTSGATAADVSLAEARLASLRGEFGVAQNILKEALKVAPAQQQQRMSDQLVQVTLAARDIPQARAILLSQHKQQPNNLGVVRRLGELDLEQRNLNGVREWEGKLKAAGPMGEQYARYFRAWRLFLSATDEKDAQLQDALREIEQIVLLRPNWAEAATLRGMVEQRLGRREQAVAAYERAVQLGERRVIVFEQLISLLDALKRSTDVDRYLARLESDLPLSQRLAEIAMANQIRRDRPEQAIEIARMRARQRPDDPLAQLWLSRLLMITGKVKEAEEPLRHATELAPGDSRYWNALIDFYVRTKNREQIDATIERLTDSKSLDATQKSLLLARCYEVTGNRQMAEKHYGLAADSAPADVAIQLRIAQFYMQRNPQQSKKHLEAALKLDPASTPAKQMLAIVHAALGEITGAEALLSVASEDGTIAADDVRLNALLLLQRGGEANLSLAVSKIEELIGRDSLGIREQATDRLLLARLYEQQARLRHDANGRGERLRKSEQQLVSVAQLSDAAPSHVGALIQFLIRQDRRHEATVWLDRLETRVQSMPTDDPAVVALLIQLQLQHQSPQRAEKWVAKLETIDTIPLRALALRVQLAVALDNKADLPALIEPTAGKLEPAAKSPDERIQIVAAVGDLYFGHKRDADAERWYRKLLSLDAKRYTPLVKVLQRQANIKGAITACRDALQTDESVQPYLLLASVLIEGKPSAAEFESAEPLFKAGLEKFESDPRLLYGLGLVRVMQKRDADSIVLFRKVVAASPRSIPALNNLAMLLADIPSERPEALRLIDQAIDFAGQDAALLDTKGAILLYSGRSAEAVALLELATRESTADPRHHFHLALAYRDQGRIDEAKLQLKTALDRELVSQVLTNTDQQLLSELRSSLKM